MVLVPGVALAAVAIKRAGPSDPFPPSAELAAVTPIPNSALVPSTTLYTDSIGGGIGPIAVMTGGGNSPGVGDPSGRNDDGFMGPINLGFTLNFFGTNYTQFWANNNGNISFTGGIAAFTPTGPQGATVPVISPFFADVDTRNSASGVMHVRTDIPNEIIVTWSQVGYYSSNADKLDNFQLVLRGPGFAIPSGEGQIGFFYTNMQWEVGDASGGSGGFCPAGSVGTSCSPAAIGFGDGQSNGYILAASQQANVSGTVANHHIWFNLVGGVPTPVPPPPQTAASLTSNFQDLWFNPNEFGQEYAVFQQGNVIVTFLEVYDGNSRPTWFVGVAPLTATNVYSGGLYVLNGTYFGTLPFNPAALTVSPTGTVTFTFTDAYNGTLAYSATTSTGTVNVSKQITRQTFAPIGFTSSTAMFLNKAVLTGCTVPAHSGTFFAAGTATTTVTGGPFSGAFNGTAAQVWPVATPLCSVTGTWFQAGSLVVTSSNTTGCPDGVSAVSSTSIIRIYENASIEQSLSHYTAGETCTGVGTSTSIR